MRSSITKSIFAQATMCQVAVFAFELPVAAISLINRDVFCFSDKSCSHLLILMCARLKYENAHTTIWF